MTDKRIYITSIIFAVVKMASHALPGASQLMQTCGLRLCSSARRLRESKRSRELCNQGTDSFKISLGGHGRVAPLAGTGVALSFRLSVVTTSENFKTTL